MRGDERRWRVVEVLPGEATAEDLTDGELLGLSVLAANYCRNAGGLVNVAESVYARAWRKIQPQVERTLETEHE